jgi:hypothetical protein
MEGFLETAAGLTMAVGTVSAFIKAVTITAGPQMPKLAMSRGEATFVRAFCLLAGLVYAGMAWAILS